MRKPVPSHKHDEEATQDAPAAKRKRGRRHFLEKADAALNSSKNFVSGFMSAVVSKSVLAPLERVKMDMVLRHRKGVLPTFRVIVAQEGPLGLWKGNAANLLRIAPFKGINFLCYDLYRKALIRHAADSGQDELRVRERLLAGALAGMTATITCFPLDLVRTRLLSSSAYSSAFGALRDVACKEGIGALYVGCVPALIGMAPAGAVFYGSYDMLKFNHLHRLQQAHSPQEESLTLPPAYTLLYGGIAGILSECVVYPLEVVRRRMQLQSMAAAASAEEAAAFAAVAQARALGRLRAAFVSIAQEQGPLGYYAGLVPNLAQVLPSAALSYLVYETCKRVLHVRE